MIILSEAEMQNRTHLSGFDTGGMLNLKSTIIRW